MTYKIKWTPELVRERFFQFIEECDREPSTLEIDGCDYLPSARQIQRIYGGLPNLVLASENLTVGDIQLLLTRKKILSQKI